MKFLIFNTSRFIDIKKYDKVLKEFKVVEEMGGKTYVEINSLEQLEKMQRKLKCALILTFRKERCIEIYDDYKE